MEIGPNVGLIILGSGGHRRFVAENVHGSVTIPRTRGKAGVKAGWMRAIRGDGGTACVEPACTGCRLKAYNISKR